MPSTFTYQFNTPVFKGDVEFSTGLYINGKFVDGAKKSTIDVINPSTGKLIAKVTEGSPADVDDAVKAAHHAFEHTWGLNTPGRERGVLLNKLAQLVEDNIDAVSAVEALDNGKTFTWAKSDVQAVISTFRYYGGWADKNQGKTIETSDAQLVYTRHEPIGVVGQIIPWNFPILMLAWKIGPALATGNTIVLKPSEFTPLSALFIAKLVDQAGFPPGVVNIINGYGSTIGQHIAEHMDIEKIAFTGSTLVGRKIMEAAAKSNLKNVTLELGGKSPNVIFDDCDIDAAVSWAAFGIYYNHGQTCCAGSRIFVHEKIYDEFLHKFTERSRQIKVGDPFEPEMFQGPQVSEVQYDRIMGYIQSGKEEGATLHHGGNRIGEEGYFIQPTIFTDVKPHMKIVQEEIFGPVGVIIKFKDEDDIIAQANDTVYGLAAAVFTRDISKAIKTANRLKAGTVWVNCANFLHPAVPFGGYKQSGIGRELGEYALANYTHVKSVQVNLDLKM
ncbi:aldehyde dehydrogenase [Laetiporus sulphureus 93-53]|uniref:Aldehyde dehydrogenase n=1 Tax=Laetiporus sulphureus 93-53 TaxID=1314785 RepID=A0A165ATW0_9APHY|nr:aldehyde dehydrogenase [Laetiporus sulphureus 93-53]KZS99653.1 aldehyde dehydrogenase [Laetiporus sulphureus 93-53]